MSTEAENNRKQDKKEENHYYLYKHSSKRVRGKKNQVLVDNCIGKIIPEGVEKSGSQKAVVKKAEVIVKEYEFSRFVEVLCPAGRKGTLGKNDRNCLTLSLSGNPPKTCYTLARIGARSCRTSKVHSS